MINKRDYFTMKTKYNYKGEKDIKNQFVMFLCEKQKSKRRWCNKSRICDVYGEEEHRSCDNTAKSHSLRDFIKDYDNQWEIVDASFIVLHIYWDTINLYVIHVMYVLDVYVIFMLCRCVCVNERHAHMYLFHWDLEMLKLFVNVFLFKIDLNLIRFILQDWLFFSLLYMHFILILS